MKTKLLGCFALWALLTFSVFGEDETHSNKPPWRDHEERQIEGWVVHVDRQLLDGTHPIGPQALKILSNQLYDIERVMPPEPLEKLRQTPIWIDLDHELKTMQYHPDRNWLVDHGYDPAMTKAVHIPDAGRFVDLQKSNDQPWVVLHELAHAFHDRVLGFDHAAIKSAYAAAVQSGRYESVLHISGKKKRHYALSDHKEYFAEASEAFFGANDFYPFVRAELKEHDPELFEVLTEVWGKYQGDREASGFEEKGGKRP